MPILFSTTSSDGVRTSLTHTRPLLSLWAGAAIIFALALLCSGQSASLVATVAGQIVSEGFLRWRVSVCIATKQEYLDSQDLSTLASHAAPPHAAIGPHPLSGSGCGRGAAGDQRDAHRVAGRSLSYTPIYHPPASLAHILTYCDAGACACTCTAYAEGRRRGRGPKWRRGRVSRFQQWVDRCGYWVHHLGVDRYRERLCAYHAGAWKRVLEL
jgi:hypothetical protein